MARCLVIVSRDQPGLFEGLAAIYREEDWIQIRLDRRQPQAETGTGDRPDRRALPNLDADLRERGFIVISRPALTGAPR